MGVGITVDNIYAKYKTNLAACGITFLDENNCIIRALLQAIVDDIHENGEILSSGTHDEAGEGSHEHPAGKIK